MKKTAISILISLILIFSLLPLSAFADNGDPGDAIMPRSGVYPDRYEIDIDGITYSVYKESDNFELEFGTENDYVPIAQRALLNVKAHYGLNFASWSPITRYFGTYSVNATTAFQQWWNDHLEYFYGSAIYVDGKVGDQTWRRFVTVCW